MKKILLSIHFLLFAFFIAMQTNAQCIGDITSIINAKIVNEYNINTNVDEIDTIVFGNYYQKSAALKEPVEWLVLDKQGDKALLLSKKILKIDYFGWDEATTWETSDVRKWMNNMFYNNCFSDAEKSLILSTNVKTEMNPKTNISGCNDTYDKLFCLSINECLNYFSGIKFYEFPNENMNDMRAVAKSSKFAIKEKFKEETESELQGAYEKYWDFWLRNFGYNNTLATYICGTGDINADGLPVSLMAYGGYRPAMWVNINNSNFTNSISNPMAKLINDIYNANLVKSYKTTINVEEMDTVTFGEYPQSDASGNFKEPIEWLVLSRDENKKRAMLLSKYILDCKPYHNMGEKGTFDVSFLNRWLNNDFLNSAFNNIEKNQILNTQLQKDLSGEKYYTKIFLLNTSVSCGENSNNFKHLLNAELDASRYEGSTKTKNYSIAATIGTNYAKSVNNNSLYIEEGNYGTGNSYYWLLEGYTCDNIGNYIHKSGFAHRKGVGTTDNNVGVRPVLYVSLDPNGAKALNEQNWHPNYDPNHEKQLGHASKDRLDLSKITAVGFPGNKSNGWIGDYYYENGAVVKNQWRQYNSNWYYCGETGAILKNQWIDNTYYVDSNGKMLKNTTTPDGYKVGDDGKYIEETKNTFTNQDSKNVLGDNVHIEGADVYLNTDGSYQIGGTPEEGATMVQSGGNHKVRDDIVSVQLSLDIEMVKCVGEYDENTTIDKIETVKFGTYPQKNKSSKDPIEWVVLEKKEGKALLLSKYILDTKRYDERDTWDANCNYYNSSIREGLNNTFYRNAFNDEEKKSILENSEVNNDKIFSLSVGECVKYFKVKSNYYHEYPQNKKVATKGTNYALNGAEQVYWSDTNVDWEKHKLVKSTEGWSKGNSRFWLRTNSSKKNIIDCDGAFYTIPTEVSFTGVRPAMWVKYEGSEYIVNETTINEDDYLPRKPDLTFEILSNMIDSVKVKTSKEFLLFGKESNYVEIKFTYYQDAIKNFDMNGIKRIDDNYGFIIQKVEPDNSGKSIKIYVSTKEEAQIILENINSKRYYALKFYK